MSSNYYIINKELFLNEKYTNMNLTSKIAYSVLYDLLDENNCNTNYVFETKMSIKRSKCQTHSNTYSRKSYRI